MRPTSAQTSASWVSPTSGNWTDPTKWSTNPAFPDGASHHATIAASGTYTVTLDNQLTLGTLTLASAGATLAHASGTLTLAGLMDLQSGTYSLQGGYILGGTITGNSGSVFRASGTSFLQNVTLGVDTTIAAGGTLEVRSGLNFSGDRQLTLNSTSSGAPTRLYLNGSSTTGSGEIVFEGDDDTSIVWSSGGSFGPQTTIRSGTAGGRLRGPGATVLNEGTISSQTAQHGIVIGDTGYNLFNSGTLQAINGGTMQVHGLRGDAGTIIVGSGSGMSLDGTLTINRLITVGSEGSLIMSGTWSNMAGIQVNGGVVQLKSPQSVTPATIGTISGSGGTVVLSSTLINSGNTLTLDRAWVLQPDGVSGVLGGTITTNADIPLVVRRGTGLGAALGLDVNLDVNVTVETSAQLAVGNVNLLASQIELQNASIGASSPASISGTGTILFNGTNNRIDATAAPLTLGSGIAVRTGSGGATLSTAMQVPLINNGTISAATPGTTVFIDSEGGTFSNQNHISVSNGSSLALRGNWVNNGSISIDGGSLLLFGTPPAAGLGAISRTGGTVALAGTWALAGSTFTIDNQIGSVVVANGATIAGGTLASSGTATYSIAGSGTFDGVTLASDLFVLPGADVAFRNSWQSLGVVRSSGATLSFGTFSPNQLDVTSGTINFYGTLNNTGNTLALGNSGTRWNLIDGGVINGGTIASTGAKLRINDGSINSIDHLSAEVLIPHGSTLTGGITFGSGGKLIVGDAGVAVLTLSGEQALDGPGEVVYIGRGSISGTGTLTLGSLTTIRNAETGSLNISKSIVSNGTISSEVSTRLIRTSSFLTNAGTIEARNGGTFRSFSTVGNISSGVLTGGAWAVYGGSSITLGASQITTNNANVLLDGEGSIFGAINPLATNQSRFTIRNGRDFTTAGGMTNSGTIVIGTNSTLTVSGTLVNTGTIDVSSAMIVDYANGDPTPLPELLTQIIRGHSAGEWNGDGINSAAAAMSGGSVRLGYLDDQDLTRVRIEATFGGDANLDGVVNVIDLGALASNWNEQGYWWEGDFNYDLVVNGADLLILANNWQAGSGAPAESLGSLLEAFDLPPASVPEPSLTGLLAAMAGGIALRRRCRS